MLIELRERVAERGENRAKREYGDGFMPWPSCPYQEDPSWESDLHALIDQPWPCPEATRFNALWAKMIEQFASVGTALGRGAFGGWGDGEPGFVRSLWCITRHLRPAKVLETGVARGITSRFILEALDSNGSGHLWSIDRPPPGRNELREEIGTAVPDALRSRWSYVKGSSRRRLPALVTELREIDLFVHDSRHSERNLLYELEQARVAVRPGGILAADDVDLNCGLHRYLRTHPDDRALVCPAEPLRPDPGRQNDRGVFALVVRSGS